jgi:O-antigen/teichoic acid export membrane protein
MSRVEQLGLQAKVLFSTTSQTVGNVVIALGGVAVVRITTHQLGPREYGTFALIVTYVTLLSMLADLGVTAMTSIEMGRQDADHTSILSSALSFRVALSLIAIPIIQGTAVILYPHETTLFRVALAVMSLDVLFATLQLTLATAFIARVRGDRIAALNVFNRVLYVAGVVVVAIERGTYFDYICAYVGADFIVAVLYVVAVQRSVLLRWSANVGQWWQMARVALPLGAIQIIGSIYLWIDSIMVSIIGTKTQLGLYSLGFNVVAVVLSIPMFLMQALLPSLVGSTRELAGRLVNKACYLSYCIGALLAVAGVVLRQDAVLTLGGPKFLLASTPFAILFVTVPLTSLQVVLSYSCVALDSYRPMVPLAISALVLNVVLNALLIPRFGPSGAATALLISESVGLLATYLMFHQLTGIRADWGRLWRPTVAALAVLPLTIFRATAWAELKPIWALCVGGGLVVAVYLVCLGLLGGLPTELRQLLPRSNHARSE